MDGIPPARDTDAEDVVWALQTAEALWKRNERGDAIVWLRRAAQAAGEANDDDRALVLAREAAELTDWFARSSSASLHTLPPLTEGSVGGVAIDSLLRSTQVDSSEIVPVSIPQSELVPASEVAAPSPPVQAPPPPVEPPASPSDRTASVPRVPTAAESHAGMLDPWAEESGKDKPTPLRPSPTEVDLPPLSGPDDGVVTSVAPPKPTTPPAAPKVTLRAPKPPLPPRTRSQELTAVPPPLAPNKPAREPSRRSPFAEPKGPEPTEAQTAKTARDKAEPEPPIGPLDLAKVEAFADLPDDSRDRLANDATLKAYSKGEGIESFSLAYIVSGEAHVIASGAASQATTIGKGTVLLARGTLETTIGLRLASASPRAVIATWDAAGVEAAMGSCPWVEEELRATGDRIQALAGASLGALGERLSPDLRATIVDKMSIRTFAEHETIVTEGLPVPGILLVGLGTVDLVANQVVTTQVKPGEFVLPAEALSAGPSPASARAGSGGALVFAADRKTTQELFATEPLLLELFAGW
jgi:hypothetical protein